VTSDQKREVNMLIRNLFASVGTVAFVVGAVWGTGTAVAQDAGTNWQAERATLQAKVNQRVDQLLAQEVSKQKVAQFLKFPWPVLAPKERKDEVVKRIEQQIDKEAKAKFPEAKRKEFEKEAAEMFRVYKHGDEVPEFQLARTMGTNTIVRKGRVYQVTEQRIQIGSRWLIPDDLTDDMKARFYEDKSAEAIKRHVRVRNNEYNQQISDFKAEQLGARLPAAFLAAGYCPRGRENLDSTNPDKWLARTEAVDLVYEARKKQLEAEIVPRVSKEVFETAGYEFVKENKQWMPKNEAAAFRAKLAAEEAAKNAAKGPELDIFGGGQAEGGMGPEGMGGSGGPGKAPKEQDIFE